MKKKGIFSKIFSINLIAMLICIILLGSTQTVLVTNYITDYNEGYLSKNVDTIVNMIKNHITVDGLNDVIGGFARAMGSHIFVFDTKGRVIASSSNSGQTASNPQYLGREYTKTVLSGQHNSFLGTMNGVFKETMFTMQVPVKDDNNKILGAVSVSRPIPEHQKMKYDLFKILFISLFVMATVSFLLSYFLAKNISVPIRKISMSTTEFAKGKFDVRVDLTERDSNIFEVYELAEAFNNMAYELEKSEQVKNTFISDVSHELRTPMTTIGGFISGIIDGTIPEEKHREYLEIVNDEIKRLSRLVNTFLDITRIQSDNMIPDKVSFDINEMIRIVTIGLENKISEKKIDVEFCFERENMYVFADKDFIMRVITNLMDNAVKFTNEKGKITVSVIRRQNEVVTSVKNTGVGISEENLPMVFKRFYKEDKSRSTNKDGTGIGLYLVKNLISAHGKKISVYSKEGEYAEFVFTLDKGKPVTNRKKFQ